MYKSKFHTIILSTGFIAFLLLLIPFIETVPPWDAGWYTACLLNATEAKFQFRNFNCVGHTSVGYMLLLAFGQYLDFGNIILLHGTNILLWYLAVLSFYGILRTLWSNEKLREEQALLSIALLFMPTISASLLHLNLDFGVLVFALPTVFFLVRRQFPYAAITGTLMAFSKETGAALYIVILTALGISVLKARLWDLRLLNLRQLNLRLGELLKSRAAASFIFAPLALYGARIAYRIIRAPDLNVFYTEEGLNFQEKPFWQMVFDLNIFEPTFRTYLIDVFILQFQWIFTAGILIGITTALMRSPFLKRTRNSDTTQSANTRAPWIAQNLFVILLLLGTIYLLTRHRPFNHSRYLLCALPMFLLVFHSISIQTLHEKLRRAAIWLSIFFFAFSSVSTTDPISKYLMGTFQFGERPILNMSSAFFVPNALHSAGFNRDELVYNFEYTRMLDLTEAVFRDIELDGKKTFIGSVGSRFFWPGLVQEKSRRRTARRKSVFRPHYFEDVAEFSHVVEKPEILYYIEFPNMTTPAQLAQLHQWYDYINTRQYTLDGYAIKVHVFKYRLATPSGQLT
jgi:hypothetical protein